MREKFATLAFGMAFLGSAAIGKPLIWYLARASEARKGRNAAKLMDDNRQEPQMRRAMMIMTLVWGFGFVIEFAISVVLVYTLPITEYLMIGPIIGYGTIAALGFWTYRYISKVRASRGNKNLQTSDR